ncbi:MAG: hypothetical protein ABIP03_01160 [Aquihabitans sp.]
MRTRPLNLIAVMAVVSTLFLGACGASGGDEAGSTTSAANGATTNPGDDGDNGGSKTTTTKGDSGGGKPAKVSGEARPYVDAMVKSLQDEEDGLEVTDAQAECISSRMVDTIGADRMKAAGVTPENLGDSKKALEFETLSLTEKDANKLYDHFGECGINLRDEMMKSMSEGEDLTPAAKACFETALSEENLRTLMVTTMMKGADASQDDPALGPVMGAIMGCAFMGMGDSTTVPAG